MRFDGKVALVTGAGSGIGKATVDQFLAGRAQVIAVDVVAPTLQGRWTVGKPQVAR
jgi:meso-butanediol dehydrogenase/(S,S)-butanediol dehydrogenase/diacetyl reductase